jgi:hypothetical protein
MLPFCSKIILTISVQVGGDNEFGGGLWFFPGDVFPGCLVNARGERCTSVDDVDLRRSLNGGDDSHTAKRLKTHDQHPMEGFEPAPAPDLGAVGIPIAAPLATPSIPATPRTPSIAATPVSDMRHMFEV